MGIVSLSGASISPVFLAPMRALVNWFVPAQAPFGLLPVNTGEADAKRPRLSRLRIVREFDPASGPACAGRMVISGRMADVCAELERMVQSETAVH